MSATAELVTTGGLPYRIVGNQRETNTKITLDNSYAEGGEEIPLLGLNVVEDIIGADIQAGPESEEWIAYATYTPTTNKIHLFSAKTGKELAKEKDMSKVVVNVRARGR